MRESPICGKSRDWCVSLRCICLHTLHTTFLPALAWRMGTALLHAGLCHDNWGIKHHGLGQIHWHLHWSCHSVIVWVICQGNPFALAFLGWVVSLPCFYLIIAKGKGPFGRFIMLTYNLSCLYAYSLSIKDGDDDDDEGGVTPIITEIVLHRVVAVLAGVIWGMIITRVIWPISARQKFKDGLSLLWLRMGLIWKRDPLSTLLEGESQHAYMNLREEFALQRYGLSAFMNLLPKAANPRFSTSA